jgi:hypothetical protein
VGIEGADGAITSKFPRLKYGNALLWERQLSDRECAPGDCGELIQYLDTDPSAVRQKLLCPRSARSAPKPGSRQPRAHDGKAEPAGGFAQAEIVGDKLAPGRPLLTPNHGRGELQTIRRA